MHNKKNAGDCLTTCTEINNTKQNEERRKRINKYKVHLYLRSLLNSYHHQDLH